MRPSCEQLLERHAGDLAPHAVEAGEDHRVRRVVDDEVDAGEVLERADVAALAADDAALHVVGGELDDRHRRLGGVAGGHALHDDGEDVAHAAVGVALGLLLDLAHAARAVVARSGPRARAAGSAWPARRSARRRARARARGARAARAISASLRSRTSSSRRASVARCSSSAASLASRRSSSRTISPRRSLRSASTLPPLATARRRRPRAACRRGAARPAPARGARAARPPPAARPAASTTAAITISISVSSPLWAGGAPTRAHIRFGSARPGSRHRAREDVQ